MVFFFLGVRLGVVAGEAFFVGLLRAPCVVGASSFAGVVGVRCGFRPDFAGVPSGFSSPLLKFLFACRFPFGAVEVGLVASWSVFCSLLWTLARRRMMLPLGS